jgi:hypothetical protein
METLMSPDAAYEAVAREIASARNTLLEMGRASPGWWDPYDLKTSARNGCSGGAVALALNELLDEGIFVAAEEGVRLIA